MFLQWKKKMKAGTRNDSVAQDGIYSRQLRDQDHRGLALSGENGPVYLKVERSSGYKKSRDWSSQMISKGLGGVFWKRKKKVREKAKGKRKAYPPQDGRLGNDAHARYPK